MIVDSVNPKIITWARKQSRVSIEELAVRMKRNPEEIAKWESGDDFPSLTCLEDLAYKHLKVPLAVFFFPEPPKIEKPENKLRRLPEYELSRFSVDTFLKLRLGMGYQNSLKELMADTESNKKIFEDLNVADWTPKELAKKARTYMEITMSKQFAFHSPEQAFKFFRFVLESNGVFTFKDSFIDRFVSGFCLMDKEYPIIMINNTTAFSRQLFTLMHELGHILYGVNGVTDVDESYIDKMSDYDRDLEIRCNRFAAEVLVPEEQFKKDIHNIRVIDEDVIAEIAEKYSVSREVILRRMLDYNRVTNEYYNIKSQEWNSDYLRNKKNVKGGGDYYLTRLSYIGEGFAALAFHNYYSQRISKVDLASHLNIKAKNIDKIESYLRQR